MTGSFPLKVQYRPPFAKDGMPFPSGGEVAGQLRACAIACGELNDFPLIEVPAIVQVLAEPAEFAVCVTTGVAGELAAELPHPARARLAITATNIFFIRNPSPPGRAMKLTAC
jgi:hypothetical protein